MYFSQHPRKWSKSTVVRPSEVCQASGSYQKWSKFVVVLSCVVYFQTDKYSIMRRIWLPLVQLMSPRRQRSSTSSVEDFKTTRFRPHGTLLRKQVGSCLLETNPSQESTNEDLTDDEKSCLNYRLSFWSIEFRSPSDVSGQTENANPVELQSPMVPTDQWRNSDEMSEIKKKQFASLGENRCSAMLLQSSGYWRC